MSARLRSEVLTFLIADVRGYTSFTRTHGDEAAAALAVEFAEIAREGIEAHGGQVTHLKGDEAVAAFRSVREALRAAADLQQVFADERALRPSLPLNVGIGLDTGEVVTGEGDYHGAAVNLAARLCAKAAAGEILASDGVVHAARMTDELQFDEREPLALKGFDAPVDAVRVHGSEHARRFGVPRTPSEVPPELDVPTPLFGRDSVTRGLRWRWRLARRGRAAVIAIVGPSGIGKTRLAAEVAALASRDGASITYGDECRAPPPGPSLLVADDVHDLAPEHMESVVGRASLTLLLYDDERAGGEIVDAFRRLGVGIERLGPVDEDAARRIGALYSAAVPDEVVARGHGNPRLVHECVARWVHTEALRRLGRAAAETSAGREELRSLETALADGVVELQAAREAVLVHGRERRTRTDSPYKGLESFNIDDAERFFGREQLVGDVVARLAGAPLLALVGASGSGKSSALCAGVLPALAAGALPTKDRWHVVSMRPGDRPLRELDRALWSSLPRELVGRLAGTDDTLQAARSSLGEGEGLILAIDQFEEVFKVCCDDEERGGFIRTLVDAATATERNELVVIALRADEYGSCAIDTNFAELVAANHVLVTAMCEEEYRRAITRPALDQGVRVEPRLADALAADVAGEPGALPLLSSALFDLWSRREARRLDYAAYVATGGVHGAVARMAEAAYAELDDADRQIARRLFLRLAGEGGRRRVTADDLDASSNPAVARVLHVLAAKRLLTIDDIAVEIAHEALLREWPRYAAWLAEDREGRELHERLGEAAHRWESGGGESGDLYRGARLTAALDWAGIHEPELNELERRFLEDSRAASESELSSERRRNRRLRFLLAGATVLLVLAVATGAVAFAARTHARSAATAATAARLGAQALTVRDLDTSLLLAAQGVALDDTVETRANLEAVLMRSPAALRVYRPLDGTLTTVDVSHDGRRLLFGNAAGGFAVVDARLGETRRTLRADYARFASDRDVITVRGRAVTSGTRARGVLPAATTVAAVDRDSRVAAVTRGRSGGHTTSIQVVALPSGRVIHVVYPPPGTTIDHVGLSDDGRVLFASVRGVGADAIATWGVRPWRAGLTVRDARGFSSTPGFSSDDRSLVAGHRDGSVTVYSLATGTARDLHGRHNAAVTAAAFDRSGRTIASAGADAQVFVWSAATGTLRETLDGGGTLTPAFGRDGTTLYTVGRGGTGTAWDVSGTRGLVRSFRAGPGTVVEGRPVVSFDVSPDGRRLVVPWPDRYAHLVGIGTGRGSGLLTDTPAFEGVSVDWASHARIVAGAGPNSRAVVWRVVDGAPEQEPARVFLLPSAGDVPQAVSLSNDARTLAVGTAGGTAIRFSVDDGTRVGRPVHARSEIREMSLSPDAALLAAAAGGGAFVWDASGRLLYRLRGATESVIFSPDGRLLAAGGADGTIRLVDTRDGRPSGPALRGTAAALSLAFTPDGRSMAAGFADGMVRLYDVASRRPIGSPLPGVPSVSVGVRFTPDATSLVSVYSNGQAFVFDLRRHSWERAACATAGRTLTRAEWTQYLPGRRYAPVCGR